MILDADMLDRMQLDKTLHALADPTRRAIVGGLIQGPRRVTDVSGEFDMSLNAVSKHIKVLEGARLVAREVRGREHFIHLDPEPMAEVDQWLATYREFWTIRLRRLNEMLEKPEKAHSKGKSKSRRDVLRCQ